jgi:hypothetical protein
MPTERYEGTDDMSAESSGVQEITGEVRTSDRVMREVGDWVVHTFLDANGQEIQSVGYPKKPVISREALEASTLEDDEYYTGQTTRSA